MIPNHEAAGSIPASTTKRKFPLAIRIFEVERELQMRNAVYPGQVARRKMNGADARHRTEIMQDVLDTLNWLREHEPKIKEYLEGGAQGAHTVPKTAPGE